MKKYNKKTITGMIERGITESGYSIYVKEDDYPYGILGTGETVEEAKQDFLAGYQEMKECREKLSDLGVPYMAFYEQDLGNLLTSISFLVEDRVWDTKAYPANEEELDDISSDIDIPIWLIMMGGKRNLAFRNFLKSKRLAI